MPFSVLTVEIKNLKKERNHGGATSGRSEPRQWLPGTRGFRTEQRFTGRRCAPQGDETSPLLGPTPPWLNPFFPNPFQRQTAR